MRRRHFRSASAAMMLLALTLSPALRAQSPMPNQPSEEARTALDAIQREAWSEAIAACEAWTAAEPRNGAAWLQYGYAHHAAGNYREALSLYQRATEFPRVRAMALYNRGCAFARLDESDNAFVELEAAIVAGFGDPEYLAADADLASLHEDARWAMLLRRATPIKQLATEFAFWVGEWDVFHPSGTQVGTSRITIEEGGCLIIEHWANMQGATGQSYNFVDPADRRWHQVWVDPSGSVVRYDGDLRDGSLCFTGTNTNPFGSTSLARATFTPNPDGTVRQFIEHSTDNGATWSTYFEGIYRPRRTTPSE